MQQGSSGVNEEPFWIRDLQQTQSPGLKVPINIKQINYPVSILLIIACEFIIYILSDIRYSRNKSTLYLFTRFNLQCPNIPTYQPDDNGVVAHLGSSMQRCHPIIGSDARIRPAILDQVLDDFQMSLLAGQVERCGTILSLGVDNAAGKRNSKANKETKFLLWRLYVTTCPSITESLKHKWLGRNIIGVNCSSNSYIQACINMI